MQPFAMMPERRRWCPLYAVCLPAGQLNDGGIYPWAVVGEEIHAETGSRFFHSGGRLLWR